MKIAFFGTPEFSTSALEILNKIPNFEIVAVFTQPDRPVGRKKILTPPPVKSRALKLNLKVLQPENQRELINSTKDLDVDFFIVVAYGMILKEEVLNIPKHGSINIHASLLPKYRGASPIQQALLNGDKETGVTIMKIDKKLDHGPIYMLKKIPIEENDNLEILTHKLAILGSQLLPLTLEDIKSGKLKAIEQQHSVATHCGKIKKIDGQFQWQKSTAREILNMIKAYTPWPTAYTKFKEKNLKIIEAKMDSEKIPAGEYKSTDKTLKVGTKEGTLELTKVQIEGSQAMKANQFINGYF